MAFVNSLISFFNTGRLSQIGNYATYADTIQADLLRQLLQKASQTEIGRTYDFRSISNATTFRERVPMLDYEGFRPWVERMQSGEKNMTWPGTVRWYAKSSGTTGSKSKFIPITQDALEECHFRGARDVIAIYLRNYPESQLIQGKCLTLGGSHRLNAQGGFLTGDLSAILIENSPFWSNFIRTPRPDIVLLDKWEEKLEKVTQATMNENITSLAGVPSWLLILLKHILQRTGRTNLRQIWPNLELFIHGGINFTPYRQQYDSIVGTADMHYMETYNASEGFFAIQSDPTDPAMLLMLDYGVFYEFVPMSELGKPYPRTCTIDEVRTDVDYAMAITTNGGLWRYLIGDTVRFRSLNPHKIIISGRTKHYINAFGEELMIDNAERALEQACQATGASIHEYSAGPVFMDADTKGCHQWIIEFDRHPADIDSFAHTLDTALQNLNSDYEAKRSGNVTLAPPIITVGRQGLFFDWMKQRDKLGGQNKVPRLANNRDYIDQLLKLNQ